MKVQNCSIYCLVNEQDKKIDIRYTRDYNIAIQRLLGEINEGSTKFSRVIQKDLQEKRVQYRIIETVSLDLMKLRHAYWVKYYNELGYISYRNRVNIVEYRVMILLNSETMCLEVVLRNRANVKILVGIFDNVPELEEFVQQYYSEFNRTNIICDIVYSFNPLTKLFYNSEK